MQKSKTLKTAPEDRKAPEADNRPDEAVDGRRARSERSRQKIIEALFKLVRSGELGPNAARVAETANVSLRTVFRHFEDMDSLYREMSSACEDQFLPTFMRPYTSPHWKGRLVEHCERRLNVFEEVMYLRICTEARRHQSDMLMEDYKRLFRLERSGLEALLPDTLNSGTELFAALDVALCFETYRRLRQENGLSPQQTRKCVLSLLEMILAGADR